MKNMLKISNCTKNYNWKTTDALRDFSHESSKNKRDPIILYEWWDPFMSFVKQILSHQACHLPMEY